MRDKNIHNKKKLDIRIKNEGKRKRREKKFESMMVEISANALNNIGTVITKHLKNIKGDDI